MSIINCLSILVPCSTEACYSRSVNLYACFIDQLGIQPDLEPGIGILIYLQGGGRVW